MKAAGKREITVTLTKDELFFIHFALNESIHQCRLSKLPVMVEHLEELRENIKDLEQICK